MGSIYVNSVNVIQTNILLRSPYDVLSAGKCLSQDSLPGEYQLSQTTRAEHAHTSNCSLHYNACVVSYKWDFLPNKATSCNKGFHARLM